MVRIPSFTRRGDRTDDRTDDREDFAERRTAEYDRNDMRDDRDRDHNHDRDLATDTHVVERPAPPPTADAPVTTTEPAVIEQPVRARASLTATLALVFGVLAAAGVATGVLAVPGVAVGLLGVLLAVGGLAATGRPHVAGRFDAMLGLLLSLAAVVVGLLALGNAIPWPETETNQVAEFADWLKAEIPWIDRF